MIRGALLRILAIALPLAPALAPEAAIARPADVAGWQAARWGMSEAELDRAFGEALAQLPVSTPGGRWVYGNAYATRYIEQVPLGENDFRALFQMNDDTDRLQQVLLEPQQRARPEATFRDTLDALRATYGPADARCATRLADGTPRLAEYQWRFATTVIHLTFLDFYSTAILFEGKRFGADPLTEDDGFSGANPRFLPRRALVRFHASGRPDLEAAGCTPDAAPPAR